MEAADTKKKAKPKKSDKDIKDSSSFNRYSYFYPRKRNAKYAEIPRNAYGKDSGVLFFHKEGSNQY